MRVITVTVLLMATVLAGCTDNEPTFDEEEAAEGLELEATDTTGVIRGVVVDPAIRPVPGVTITLPLDDGTLTTETNEEGAFGFADLQPGSYFVKASKPGWFDAQSSVEVVANVDRPAVVKILFEPNPSTAPYVQAYQFDGFIECSFSLLLVGFAACSVANDDQTQVTNDRFISIEELDDIPTWSQSEMVWEASQAVSPGLTLLYSVPGDEALYTNYAEDEGESPLLVTADDITLDEHAVGDEEPLIIRVFDSPMEGTDVLGDVDGDGCFDRPVLGGCTTGLGMTIQEEFTIYTHTFYHFTPPEGWRFTNDGDPLVPA